MDKKVIEILNAWNDEQGESNSNYSNERIAEIAINCVSLSETWLDRVRGLKNASLEVLLYDNDDAVCDVLHGVTSDNLAKSIFKILVNENNKYSKIGLNCFTYENGHKSTTFIGDLVIS